MNFRECVLAELRLASMRARLAQADIDRVGVLLREGFINEFQALDVLSDDGLEYVQPTPPAKKATTT